MHAHFLSIVSGSFVVVTWDKLVRSGVCVHGDRFWPVVLRSGACVLASSCSLTAVSRDRFLSLCKSITSMLVSLILAAITALCAPSSGHGFP